MPLSIPSFCGCRAGEVFKADGEVVAGGAAAGGQQKQGSYQLTASVQPLAQSHSKLNTKITQSAGSKQEEEEQNKLLVIEMQKLQKDLIDAKTALQAAQEHMARARSQLSHLQEKASSSNGCMLMLRQQSARGGDVQQMQEALKQEWSRCDAAATEAEQHQTAAAAADSKVQEAQQQLDNALADSMGSKEGKLA